MSHSSNLPLPTRLRMGPIRRWDGVWLVRDLWWGSDTVGWVARTLYGVLRVCYTVARMQPPRAYHTKSHPSIRTTHDGGGWPGMVY